MSDNGANTNTHVMMVVLIRIFALGLMALGGLILFWGIKQILKWVGGPVLIKLPLQQKIGQFTVVKPGGYAIWQSGQTLGQVAVKMSLPAVFDLQTGKKIMVHQLFSSVRVNNGSEGRFQRFSFWAKPGQYQLELTDDVSEYPLKPAYFLEIREKKSTFLFVLNILVVILGGFCLILGIVFFFNSDALTALLNPEVALLSPE